MKIRSSLLLFALLFTGCLTPASKINAVHLGMTKAEVLAVMGPPTSVTADEKAEYLNYFLAEGIRTGPAATQTPYEVKLVNGKVVSYGRSGSPQGGHAPMVIPVPIIH